MSISEPASGRPFRDAAEKYRESGFLGTLPLPPGEKNPPPKGFTGSGRPDPTDEQVRAWRKENGDGNIALRLSEVPQEVTNKRDLPFVYAGNNVDGWELIGIDVDDYKGKHGLSELRELEAEHGPLPPTAMSTARWAGWDEHRSAIRVFLVPKGYRFMGKAAPSIDIVQKRHRFMVAAPSTNPDADGAEYEWRYGATDSPPEALREFEGGLPNVATDVALLPESWFAHLSRGGTVESDDEISDLTDDELFDWARTLRYEDEPCREMRRVLDECLEKLGSSDSSHDKITYAHWRLFSLAAEGHSGVGSALDQFHPAWRDHVVGNRGDIEAAGAELNRSALGALDKIQPAYKGLGRPEDKCAVDTGRFDCGAWAARLASDGEPAECAPSGARRYWPKYRPAYRPAYQNQGRWAR
ncbi:bifunctional DNA primase/polymerase [Mycolicibacterium porcinum]|uniref:Bifunctional DNA primase/polymerase n=1 Tax=Mycolicibacterium porcinum TaxID=39693 RepID=A0ABV3VAZ6_9MYCO